MKYTVIGQKIFFIVMLHFSAEFVYHRNGSRSPLLKYIIIASACVLVRLNSGSVAFSDIGGLDRVGGGV